MGQIFFISLYDKDSHCYCMYTPYISVSLIFHESGLQDIFASGSIRDQGGEQWTQKLVPIIHIILIIEVEGQSLRSKVILLSANPELSALAKAVYENNSLFPTLINIY